MIHTASSLLINRWLTTTILVHDGLVFVFPSLVTLVVLLTLCNAETVWKEDPFFFPPPFPPLPSADKNDKKWKIRIHK